MNLPWNRDTKSLAIDEIPAELLVEGKDTPIVTHCGGGGRGQKAKVYLEEQGFKNVINGGGPLVKELWALFGSM